MRDVVVTREQLYEEVWTVPMRQLAERYSLSDVGLAKICRRLNVPKPGLGYWAKVEAGHKMPRTPLPARALQDRYVIRIKPPPPPPTPEEIEAQEAHSRLVAQFLDLKVPDVLDRPHALTRKTQARYAKIAKEARRPRRWGTPEYSNRPYSDNGRYRCSAEEGFPILVSLDHVDRALGILDTLAKELERLGFKLTPDVKSNTLQVRKDSEVFELSLREGYRRQDLTSEQKADRKKLHDYAPDWEWVGSGKFTLSFKGTEYRASEEWTDNRKPLEMRLPEILADIVEAVPLQKQLREERLEEEKRRAEEQRRAWEAEMRRQEAKQFFDALAAEASQVDKAEAVLRYLDRLEAELGSDVTGAAKEWLERARSVAKAHNPISARLANLGNGKRAKEEDKEWLEGAE